MSNKPVYWHFIEREDGYAIVLDAPLRFQLDGTIRTIPEGYASDGMSVPRIFWSSLSPRYDPRTLKASIEHDWLYDNHICTRARADEFYRERLIQDGFPVAKAWVVWAGVRIGGWLYWQIL